MSKFTKNLASFLLWVSATMASPSSAGSGTMLAVMGQDALNEQNYAVFSQCVQSLDSDYKAYADNGVLVVFPSTNRSIDTDNSDKKLWNCIQSSSSNISLAAESSNFYDEAHNKSTDVKLIQHTDAVNMGVTGQKVVGHVAAETKTLESRDVGYFAVHYSDERDCRGDFNQFNTGGCISFASAYSSTLADNLDTSRYLQYSIWPHHSCDKGNVRIIMISPQSSCPCQARTTYSWSGIYV